MKKETFPHDSAYKAMFGFPETVKSLLLDFVPEEFVRHFDFSTLEQGKASYVTPEYRLLHDDVVWKVQWHGRESFLAIILEFQSHEDYTMSARITAYSGCFWLDWAQGHKLKHGGRLPPVFPIVLYNGEKPWSAPTNTLDLVDIPHEALVPYQPNQKYIIIDAKRVSQQALANAHGDAAYIIRGEQASNADELIQIGTEFISSETNPTNTSLRKTVVDWLDRRILEIEPEWASMKSEEKSGMLADVLRQVENARNKYREEGRTEAMAEVENRYRKREKDIFAEGKAEAKSEALARQRAGLLEMLSLRFGEIPSDWQNVISQLNDPEKISGLTISILKVKSPEEYGKLLLETTKP